MAIFMTTITIKMKTLGLSPIDGFINVNQIKSTGHEPTGTQAVIIRDPASFFSDYNHTSGAGGSVLFFKEKALSMSDENLIIIISDKLQHIPVSIYKDNPEAAVIYIDYPEIEIREEFIKNYVSRKVYEKEFFEIVGIFAKITIGRTLREIEKIFIKGEGKDLRNPRDIINYYDFGKMESPWTKLKTEDVRTIDKKLANRVLGQDEAIEYVKKILIRGKLGLSAVHQSGLSTRPVGVFFFVGPTGVGKTELSKAIAEAIFESESEFKRFDMSEYKDDSSLNKFIGSSPGYVGYEEGGQLTNWIKEHPFSVVLFDEIEKANPRIWDTFLQVLEDGRLTDNKGKTVYFTESIIIFTSNLGNREAMELLHKESGTHTDAIREIYRNSVEDYFSNTLNRVEILNRLGNNIVPFNPVDSESIYKNITISKLEIVAANIRKKINCVIKYDPDKLAGFIYGEIIKTDHKFGGRAVINYLETLFINEFALYYLDNPKEIINVETSSGQLVFS